jgi:hypothetical protein
MRARPGTALPTVEQRGRGRAVNGFSDESVHARGGALLDRGRTTAAGHTATSVLVTDDRGWGVFPEPAGGQSTHQVSGCVVVGA